MRIFIPLPRWSGRLAADLSAHFFDEVLRLSGLVKRVYVVAERMEGEAGFEVSGNVFVERVGLPRVPKLRGALKILCYVRALFVYGRGCDVVYVRTFGLPELLVCILGKFLGKPTVFRVPGTWIFEPPTLRNHLLVRVFMLAISTADRVVLYSRRMVEPLRKYAPLDEGKVVIVPNAVDSERFRKVPSEGLRRRLGIGRKGRVVLYVGRITSAKGLRYLILAAKDVLARVPGTKFVFVGDGVPSHMMFRREMINLSRKLGIDGKVIFVGRIPNQELPEYYSLADVFAYPTLGGEGVTRSVLEALSCQVPVVSTPDAGLPDVVVPFRTGVLVSKESVTELAEAIVRILEDKEASRKLGSQGRRMILEKHSWDLTASALVKVFQSVLIESARDFNSLITNRTFFLSTINKELEARMHNAGMVGIMKRHITHCDAK